MEQALQAGPADVLLLSSVLQYLQDPWQSLTEMLKLPIPHVVLDRTAVLRGGESSLLSVQHVPASIYRATYPAWFLAKNQLHDCFLKGHTVISTWQCQEHHSAARGEAEYRGWLLCQKGQQGPVAES
jgi:putative methyltransferase (TIGR04325 family)